MKTLKETLIKELNIPEENITNHCSDLHVLYTEEVYNWLQKNYEFPNNINILRANVKGHKWYGKKFLDIPFAYTEYHTNKK